MVWTLRKSRQQRRRVMRENKKYYIAGIIFIIVTLTCGVVKATPKELPSNFVKVRLPHGISIDIPRSWGILNEEGKNILSEYVESVLDLSKIKEKHNIDLKFNSILMARTISDYTYASVNITVINDPRTQKQLKNASKNELELIGRRVRQDFETGETGFRMKVVGWRSHKKDIYKGYYCVKWGYNRISQKGKVLIVDIMEIPLGDQTVSLITSYQEDHKDILENIIKRIVSSFNPGSM